MEDGGERIETVTRARRVLVSLDVRRRRKTVSTLVNRYIFGRREIVRSPEGTRRYRYPGLVHRPGVERIGQSVLLLREKDAEDFTGFLARLGVPYRAEPVWVHA
ncbi:MAG TPA: hypothetical protein VJ397_00145 [Thermoplasmata archaeon]|nr:hypothetical protein [Thermoplasmata archaeon]